jgi:hypothetical protein
VAVDLAARAVDWEPDGLDAPTDNDCEDHLPVGVNSLPDAGGPGDVRVRVIHNGVELWNLIVVRPRDSSPTTYGKGSGGGASARGVPVYNGWSCGSWSTGVQRRLTTATADRVLPAIEEHRSISQIWHVRAEAQQEIRGAGIG